MHKIIVGTCHVIDGGDFGQRHDVVVERFNHVSGVPLKLYGNHGLESDVEFLGVYRGVKPLEHTVLLEASSRHRP